MNAVRKSPEDIALVEDCRRNPAKLLSLPDHIFKSSEDPEDPEYLAHLRNQSELELTQHQRWLISDKQPVFNPENGLYKGDICPLCHNGTYTMCVVKGQIEQSGTPAPAGCSTLEPGLKTT